MSLLLLPDVCHRVGVMLPDVGMYAMPQGWHDATVCMSQGWHDATICMPQGWRGVTVSYMYAAGLMALHKCTGEEGEDEDTIKLGTRGGGGCTAPQPCLV